MLVDLLKKNGGIRSGGNCGTGAGGFKAGNSCGGGGGGGSGEAPTVSHEAKGQYVVKGGNHVFEHETYRGPESAGKRLRVGDKITSLGYGNVKAGEQAEVISVKHGTNDVKVRTATGEHDFKQSFAESIPGRAHADTLDNAPGTRAPAEVAAAQAKHGTPKFHPIDTTQTGTPEHDFSSKDVHDVYVVPADHAHSLIKAGHAEMASDTAHDHESGLHIVKATSGDHSAIIEAGGEKLIHDQGGMEAIFHTTGGAPVTIPIRTGTKQIVARQVNGDLYTTFDKKTKQYGLTTAGELHALRDRFAAEHPDSVAKHAEKYNAL